MAGAKWAIAGLCLVLCVAGACWAADSIKDLYLKRQGALV